MLGVLVRRVGPVQQLLARPEMHPVFPFNGKHLSSPRITRHAAWTETHGEGTESANLYPSAFCEGFSHLFKQYINCQLHVLDW